MPNNARLWTNLGTALQQSDNFAEARNAYEKGYDLDNKNEVGDLYLMAAIDENFGQGSKALSEYQQYKMKAGASGTYTAASNDRIAVLSKNVGATQKLATSSDIKSARAAADAYDAGVKAQQASQYDQAISSYQTAIAASRQESAYYYAMGTAYQAKGDMTNAVVWYQKAIDILPSNKSYKDALVAAKAAQVGPVMDEAVKKQTGWRCRRRYSII